MLNQLLFLWAVCQNECAKFLLFIIRLWSWVLFLKIYYLSLCNTVDYLCAIIMNLTFCICDLASLRCTCILMIVVQV